MFSTFGALTGLVAAVALIMLKVPAAYALVAGALVLLTSLITPFPYYYLTFGSLLLLIATLIRFFGY
jgi:hypothetical protein